MPKKLTHEEFIERVKIKNPNLTVLGAYVNAITEIETRCDLDGHVWNPLPNNISRVSGCPECSRRKAGDYHKKTKAKFIDELSLVRNDVDVIGEYVNIDTPIQTKCLKHDVVWNPTPYSLLQNQGCSKCKKEKIARFNMTESQFLTRLAIISPNIKVVSRYVDYKSRVDLVCLLDGHTWDATPSNLLAGKGCSVCARGKRKTTAEFKAELQQLRPHIELLSEYTSSKDEIKLRCQNTGLVFDRTPDAMLSGGSCPCCRNKSGYSTSKKGYFYVYDFDGFYGYGITNNLKTRLGNHKANFKTYGVSPKLLFVYEGDGLLVLSTEKYIKKTVTRHATNIPGFITEATDSIGLNHILDKMKEFGLKRTYTSLK